ncbi:CNH domain-containing protein [Syncephalis fuscata]|nr:CNH domain-containing protein [Syncephalis fuscata]
MGQAGPTAAVRSRAASDYRCNSLSSLNTSPVPRAISPLSGGFFSNGNGVNPLGSTSSSTHKVPIVYPALLSKVADAFRSRITLQTHYKDALEYKASFNGRDAVDVLCFIIKTGDRNLALLLGRALDSQRYFHDVTYDHRLRDNPNEIYQFREDAMLTDLHRDGLDTLQSPYIGEDNDSDHRSYNGGHSPSAATESELMDLAPSALPNGVFTLLADCYSPTCTRESLCYSISCPRRLEQQARLKLQLASGLKRTSSRSGLSGERKQTLWIESVPKEISDSVSKEEQKRQEIIYEVIYTEKDFVEDLEILERLYMEPLRYANIIWDPVELDDFIVQVFHNVSVIRQISAPLAQALLKRQEEKAVVERVGDIFLAHVDNFDPFVSYGAHQPYAKHHLDTAIQKYRELPRWLEQRERMPESRKLPIQSFLGRPTTRLARYPLLLEAVIKASPEGHPDREDLILAVEKIRVLLKNINSEAGRADTRIRLTKLNDELLCNQSDLQKLALLNPERQLVREGTLKKRANVDQVEVTVFLFDHCLLLAKRRKAKDGGGYKVHKQPIPLEMLSLTIADEPALRQTARRTSSIFSGTKGINGGSLSSAYTPAPTSTSSSTRTNEATKAGFPITLTHLGRNGMEIVLYASSQAERWQWREKIEAQRELVVQSRQIFSIITLSDRHFHKTSRVNCSAVFNQGRKLVIGTDDGVYVGMEAQPDTLAKTLDLEKVHKIEILEDYNMVLILHDKSRTLTSYPMDCLMPLESSSTKRSGRKIKSHVSFFKVGVCMNRTLVCVVKSAALYSTINTLEPVSAMNNKKKSLGMILRNNETMKVYREFYIPTESSSIHFLKTKLCVGCNKGFEVVDLETLNTLGLLDPADEALNFVLRRESARPIAIFRIRNGDFLLCYDEFAFFVNKNGRRSRPNWLVTWEGEPTAFAINYPYILAFDAKFIEVRHVVTGELEQVIPTGTLRSLNTHSESIHCVTTGRHDFQHVFKVTWNPQLQRTSANT